MSNSLNYKGYFNVYPCLLKVHSPKEIIERVWKIHIKRHPLIISYSMKVITSSQCEWMWLDSFNMEFPANVVWCGFSVLIKWFLWESVYYMSRAANHWVSDKGAALLWSLFGEGMKIDKQKHMLPFSDLGSSKIGLMDLPGADSRVPMG